MINHYEIPFQTIENVVWVCGCVGVGVNVHTTEMYIFMLYEVTNIVLYTCLISLFKF